MCGLCACKKEEQNKGKKNVEIYKNNRRGRKLVGMRIVCLKS